MSDTFKNQDGAVIVYNLTMAIHNNRDYLSEVDGAIGDGDHGINMDKGFNMCRERLSNTQTDFAGALNILGRILIMEIGGSMGPIYGTMFREMSKAAKDKEDIDKQIFYNMINGALKGIQAIAKGDVGDKTLLDTLIPAVNAFKKATDEGKSFVLALGDLKDAARTGWQSTKDMVAKFGRASRLGERSKGVYDAGATSCNIILETMADSILEILKKGE